MGICDINQCILASPPLVYEIKYTSMTGMQSVHNPPAQDEREVALIIDSIGVVKWVNFTRQFYHFCLHHKAV